MAAKLKDLKSDQLKQVSRYMDELTDGEEEVWRLFINGMSKRIYTESQIETFADENLKPRGSPSYSLLTDLSRRNMTLSEFLRIMKKIKCIKVINMFLQTTVPVISKQPPKTLSISKGDNLSLSCVADCKPPPPDYQWYFNDVPMPDEVFLSLSINKCNASHTGSYHCVVTNPCINEEYQSQSRVTSHSCRVEVLNYPIQEGVLVQEGKERSGSACSVTIRSVMQSQEDIVIIDHPTDTACHYDEEFELRCTAKSRSGKDLIFQWMAGSSRHLKEDPISSSQGSSVLKMSASGEEHIINIQCRVSVDGSNWINSNKAKVEIQYVWFEQQPQRNYHGYTGRELAMECRAVGKEPIEYLWLKDENGKKTFIQDKPGIYVDKKSGLLMFESLVAEHWGDYNCQAQNRFHFVTSDTVKVTFEPFREKVYITVQPSSFVCSMNSSVTLRCEAISPDPINHQWYQNNKLLMNETQDVLILSPINKHQLGSYHCLVNSGKNQIQSETAIVAEGAPLENMGSMAKTQVDQKAAERVFKTVDNVMYAREKVALLIANEKYSNFKPLNSPHSDIDELSKTLTDLKFKVFSFTDLKFQDIMEVLDVFVKFLDSGVYCVFYYSGHGFRFHGFDYIMPIDVARELKCDECIPFNQIAYRLQRTLSKVIMLLDCCRVNYNDSGEVRVTAPQKIFENDCGFNNIYTIWSCAVSQPAYEKKSEESSVFNCALREALKENTGMASLSTKIVHYMEANPLTRDGKVFQRPVPTLCLSPDSLTLHENIMFDEKTSSAVQSLREWHHRIHSAASVTITEDDIQGIKSGEVKYEFIRTNVLKVRVTLTKKHNFTRDSTYSVTLTESCKRFLAMESVTMDEQTKVRLKKDFIITSWQNLQEIPKEVISINVVSSNGAHSSYCPVIKTDTYWSFNK